MSLTTFGSSTKAELGAEQGDTVEVTQSGAGPEALAAVHPAGSAGAITPSKFSLKTVVAFGHGGVADGVGDGVGVGGTVAVAVAVGVGEGVPLGVGVGVGVGQGPQSPVTLNTSCMFGKPMVTRLVGFGIPHATALI